MRIRIRIGIGIETGHRSGIGIGSESESTITIGVVIGDGIVGVIIIERIIAYKLNIISVEISIIYPSMKIITNLLIIIDYMDAQESVDIEMFFTIINMKK